MDGATLEIITNIVLATPKKVSGYEKNEKVGGSMKTI